jgi:hypothetical protein
MDKKSRRFKLSVSVAILVVLVAAAAIAQAEISRKGPVQVKFEGAITPHALPRGHEAPVTVEVATHISLIEKDIEPPELLRISLALNKNGHIDYKGLPKCHVGDIQPSTNEEALRACHASLVGTGYFSANVILPEQSPFPSKGKIYAFNGYVLGHPVIFAHIYGTEPLPTSFVLPFVVRHSNGEFATTLVAYLPKVKANWGFITGIKLKLNRTFSYKHKVHHYLTASCPTPKGISVAGFPFAKAEFIFEGVTVKSTLNRSCRAKG